jgi:hypothetical protein
MAAICGTILAPLFFLPLSTQGPTLYTMKEMADESDQDQSLSFRTT